MSTNKNKKMKTGLVLLIGLLFVWVFALNAAFKQTPVSTELSNQDERTDSSIQKLESAEEKLAIQSDYTTGAKSGGKIGKQYYLVNIRFGIHEGYERVVVDLDTKSGIPLYKASLKDNAKEPLYDMKGQKVALSGPWRLELELSDVSDADTTTGKVTFRGESPFETDGSAILGGRLHYPDDDSKIIVVLELSKRSGFIVAHLSGPSRIVIDVEN